MTGIMQVLELQQVLDGVELQGAKYTETWGY